MRTDSVVTVGDTPVGWPRLVSGVVRRLGRRGVALVVLVAALAAVWGVHELGSKPKPKIFSLNTGFAGYDISGTVHEISAAILIPRTYSPGGNAASWVGLQQGLKAPFVQVGVLEAGADYDELFWSSDKAGFHPQLIGQVSPGELVTFTISRGAQDKWHWSISRAGLTSHSGNFAGYQESSFSRAEWFQEDPATAPLGVGDTYPLFGDTLRFERLGWNDTAPSLTLAGGRMMFPHDGPIEVPSPVVHDGFTLFSPTGGAAAYAALAQRFDNEFFPIGYDLTYWSDADLSRRQHDIVKYIAITSSLDTSMLALRWSATTGSYVRQYVANDHRVIVALREWERQGLSKTDGAYAVLTGLEHSHNGVVNSLRLSLDLPPE